MVVREYINWETSNNAELLHLVSCWFCTMLITILLVIIFTLLAMPNSWYYQHVFIGTFAFYVTSRNIVTLYSFTFQDLTRIDYFLSLSYIIWYFFRIVLGFYFDIHLFDCFETFHKIINQFNLFVPNAPFLNPPSPPENIVKNTVFWCSFFWGGDGGVWVEKGCVGNKWGKASSFYFNGFWYF